MEGSHLQSHKHTNPDTEFVDLNMIFFKKKGKNDELLFFN